MPFSIELFLDPKSSMAVQQCGEALEKIKIPTIFSTLGSSPHVSLAVFEQYNPERLHGLLKKLASGFPPIPFQIGSLGTFAGKEGVLFLAPVVTPALLEIHGYLHNALPKVAEGLWVYYDPGQWVAHCTLSIHLSRKKLIQGFELMGRKGFSIRGRYSHLALVETQPGRISPIRQVYSVPFSGKKK
jgi:2'-5' RNA ligase